MNIIPLTKGKSTTVSDEDYQWLMQWKWHAIESKRRNAPSCWYAARKAGHSGATIYMHSEIGKRINPLGSRFDHKDHDGLNNTRNNLRPCTQGQNVANRNKTPGKTSTFKGVSFYKRLSLWRSKIVVANKETSLGYFKHEKEAAMAYNNAASRAFGEFASLNNL